jgi:hypothetical protein
VKFSELLQKLTVMDAFDYTTAGLWKGLVAYKIRYARLRTALKALFAGLWLFLATIIIYLVFS